MKKLMGISCALLVFAIGTAGAAGKNAGVAEMAAKVTVEKYPDADAVLVDALEMITYAPDGTNVTEEDQWTKVLTEKGRRDESVQSLDYNARYGKAEILFVGILGADGTERAVDVSATTRESTDNDSMSSNIYDPLDRKITCTIPGLKVGDTLHLKTRRRAFKSRIRNQWADMSVLEWSMPIVRSTVRVKAPAERPIRSQAIRHPLGNVKSSVERQGDGSTLHTWTVENSPQAFPEPDMPPLYTQVQALHLSTAKEWQEISKWYWEISLPHLEKTTPAMTNKVAELGRDIRAIFRWVSQEVRYMGLTQESEAPGYEPHDVNVTFENRYGVCRDKAGLLVALLRIAGFEAYPVLIHAGAKMDPEVPSPYFNHAIVCVCTTGKDGRRDYTLMDPTNESSRDLMPAYLSDKSYLVARPDGETLLTSPVVPDAENALAIVSKGTLSADGSILLDTAIDFKGMNDNAYRSGLLRRKPDDRRRLFERILTGACPGAELLKCEISPADLRDTEQPLKVTLLASFPERVLRGTSRDELGVPFLSGHLGVANFLLEGNTSLVSRKYPLVIDSTARVDETISLDLGGAVGACAWKPEDLRIDGPYACRLSYVCGKDRLTARRSLAVRAVEFSPAAYTAVREGIKRTEAAARAKPLFRPNRFSNANVRYLLNRSETDFTGPRSWVTTNTVVKQILTYDGKKKASELKYFYNPTWKRVKVIAATVRNRDGKESRVSEREINEMDAGWVSSAPRYPASKQLIVNLPSVEIGSVISYVTVTEVTDSPLDYYGSWFFDSFEPADEITVRVGAWSRTVKSPKLLKAEPMQAGASFWRDQVIVSSNRFDIAAARLRRVSEVGPLKDALPAEAGGTIESIRTWMARNVRTAGPLLYEIRLEDQLTPPETVLRERYGTRLDYVRTLCAALKAKDFRAAVVFAANDAAETAAERRRDRIEHPRPSAFSHALCRVEGPAGETLYLGTENEYAVLGATGFEDAGCLDPATGRFETVRPARPEFRTRTRDVTRLFVRENGMVDFEVENGFWGAGVGAFRKHYAEMLPEDRSRHYQKLLGSLAQAAEATGDLVTDVRGYPATLKFRAVVPDFATVANDAITLTVPDFDQQLFPLTGSARTTPMEVEGSDAAETLVEITFPEGYTEIEHLPEDYTFADPTAAGAVWYRYRVTRQLKENRLTVRIVREQPLRTAAVLGADYFPLLKHWSQFAASRAERTLVVRRRTAGGTK